MAMVLKKALIIAALVIIGLTGFYLVFTSGRIDADPFNVILFLIVGGFIVYFYISKLRLKE